MCAVWLRVWIIFGIVYGVFWILFGSVYGRCLCDCFLDVFLVVGLRDFGYFLVVVVVVCVWMIFCDMCGYFFWWCMCVILAVFEIDFWMLFGGVYV